MESFFEEYGDLLNKGYGLAIFSCDNDTIIKTKRKFQDYPIIDIDDLDSFEIPNENVPHILISQNREIFLDKAESLARKIVLPLYQSKIPIIFLHLLQ
jgi:hypothetical protein